MGLTKADILAAHDLPISKVHVPAWGGNVYVRAMTAGEYDSWQHAMSKSKDDYRGLRSKLVAMCACAESGEPLFTEADIPALERKSGAAMDVVFEEAQRLNALTMGEVEGLGKGSRIGLIAVSSSVSPSPSGAPSGK